MTPGSVPQLPLPRLAGHDLNTNRVANSAFDHCYIALGHVEFIFGAATHRLKLAKNPMRCATVYLMRPPAYTNGRLYRSGLCFLQLQNHRRAGREDSSGQQPSRIYASTIYLNCEMCCPASSGPPAGTTGANRRRIRPRVTRNSTAPATVQVRRTGPAG